MTEKAPDLFIEGYADQTSYAPGDELALHVSASAPRYALDIARLGADRRVVLRLDDLQTQAYPVPENASSHGCQWPASHRIQIPSDWPSGYYEATLRLSDEGGSYTYRNHRSATCRLYFIVRPARPGTQARILLQLSTNTYAAYNNWGGYSLYAYHGRGGLQGHRVSLDRPDAGLFRRWELPFVAWAESHDYALDYCSNADLEFHPELMEKYPLVLSVGHDEYWSAPMRDHLEAYIGAGGNTAFFSGNSVCWQVRCEEEGRALTCWKQQFNQDPHYRGDHRTLSTLWSHHLVGRPENSLTGVGFLHGGYHLSHGQHMDGSGAYNVHRPDHWAFDGTNLETGDAFGGKHTIVGYECDGCEFTLKDGLPIPTHSDGTPDGFEILCTAPARWHPDDSEWYEPWQPGHEGHAVMGTYTRGGTVFTAGTTDWSHGLAGGDPTVDRITRNVLDRLSHQKG
jgi:hypothetical protein